MKPARVTVLVEHLHSLLSAAPAGLRMARLETFLARSGHSPGDLPDSDTVRFSLFGYDPRAAVPVAALTWLADAAGEGGAAEADDCSYFLRVEPVTLRPDMSRLVMTGFGFADFSPGERHEVEGVVRESLRAEGLDFASHRDGRWTIATGQPLEFSFPSIQQALGVDAADVLPEHSQARVWRRLMNEIQMALHALPVNRQRRQQGRREINSVWFWGGGSLPKASSKNRLKEVASDHPVSRGLAMLHSCALRPLGSLEGSKPPGLPSDGELIDWTPQPGGIASQLGQIDDLLGRLMQGTGRRKLKIVLVAGDGSNWRFSRASALRLWRRALPLGSWAPRS